MYANQYAKLPDDLVGSLTGLTEGAHFPVAADARYADDISEREVLQRSTENRTTAGNAADVISDSPTRRGIDIYSRVRAPVVAVNDGVIQDIGQNEKLGNYIVLMDAYGNRYTYAELGEISEVHPVPKETALTSKDFELIAPEDEDGSSDRSEPGWRRKRRRQRLGPGRCRRQGRRPSRPGGARRASRARQHRRAPRAPLRQSRAPGQRRARRRQRPARRPARRARPGVRDLQELLLERVRVRREDDAAGRPEGGLQGHGRHRARPHRPSADGSAPHVHFEIQPAGRGAPRIDPKPILDGWKLLETTAIYRAAGKDPFGGSEATIGQVLLMSKEILIQRVLADPRIETYSCGRTDIESGQIDRRTLAMLSYLVERGYRLTITSLKCGHSFYTTSGNVSAHSSGNAVDIAEVNGIPILGNQGRARSPRRSSATCSCCRGRCGPPRSSP